MIPWKITIRAMMMISAPRRKVSSMVMLDPPPAVVRCSTIGISHSPLEQVRIDVQGIEPDAQQHEHHDRPDDRLDEHGRADCGAGSAVVLVYDSLFGHVLNLLNSCSFRALFTRDSLHVEHLRIQTEIVQVALHG